MINFDIIKEFRLQVKPIYKDMDACIDEISRKGKFNPDLAEKEISEYLKDDATITLSWSILFLGICVLSMIISFLFVNNIIINSIVLISLLSSIIFFMKFKNKMKGFYFQKSMLMSFNGMLNSIE